MTEEREKTRPKNPDYTTSAVNLTNTEQVKELLDEWVAGKKLLDEANGLLQAALAELPVLPEAVKASEASALLDEARKNLEVAVKELGGYQDVEMGMYALEQVRKAVTYDPELVKEQIPVFADKILAQVDVTVLKGLLRGKLITQEQMDACAIVKESQRFVIEAVS